LYKRSVRHCDDVVGCCIARLSESDTFSIGMAAIIRDKHIFRFPIAFVETCVLT